MAKYPSKPVSNPELDALVTEYARYNNRAKSEKAHADALKKDILKAAGATPEELVNYKVHGKGENTETFYLITRTDKTVGYPDGVEARIAELKAEIEQLEALKITAFGSYSIRPAKADD